MKHSIARRYAILIGLFAVFIASSLAGASSEWPYPYECYPRDIIYTYSLMQNISEGSKFKNNEKAPVDEQFELRVSEGTFVADQSLLNRGYYDDLEPYDYWAAQ